MRRALIVQGGWEGHEPARVAALFEELLRAEGFAVEVRDTLDAFAEPGLAENDLLVPIWTMGSISPAQLAPVLEAVAAGGVGLAGCHGGMCDAFRESTEWQFMTGGQWVAHPGNDGVRYTVEFDRARVHPITEGLGDFEVVSEQYYLHVDPANDVLAWTTFPNAASAEGYLGGPCRMPQVWTKLYGAGRVFYTALGHRRDVLETPSARELCRRGFVWAARGAAGSSRATA